MSGAARPTIGSVRVGLHFAESVAAARLAGEVDSRRELVDEIAPSIPAPDAQQRRVAGTIVRRLTGPEAEVGEQEDAGPVSPLSAIVAAAGRRLDARHLMLYATARQERLVMAVASEVFYPRFVLGEPPEGMTERDFAAINTGKLLETDPVITHRLVDEHAQCRWGLEDATSTQCALRILREGGALGATWIARGETRCLGYFPGHRGPSWPIFVYALWEEFVSRNRRTVPRAHLRTMALARLFCMHGPTVDVLAEQAADAGFCAIDGRRSGGPVSVTHDGFHAAARALAEWYRKGER